MRYRRIALQHLESLMESEMALGSEKAQLLGEVCPIYRLDVDGVAYWEFEVDASGSATSILVTEEMTRSGGLAASALERLQASVASDEAIQAASRGFIMVSAGEHDFPVPHWSLQRLPVSRQLEETAAQAGKKVARVFKLDALAYLGEDEAGNEVARSGQTPVPIEGLSQSGPTGEISSMTAQPERPGKDEEAERLPHKVKTTGPKPPQLRHRDPMGWGMLKERYNDAFAPALQGLRRQAEESWRVNKLVDEFGEGIVAGRPHRLALLHAGAAVAVTGEAAPLVSAKVIERHGRPLLMLRAAKPPEGREVSFQVRIAYATGEDETLSFFVVSKETPSNVRAESAGGGPK